MVNYYLLTITLYQNFLIFHIDGAIVDGGQPKQSTNWAMRNEYVLFLFFLMCEEWGDKSQIAAIALAANYGFWSIIFGGALVITLIAFVFQFLISFFYFRLIS
jgi:putative Ca2+/H+ antiporter (TMEM165/GDT1 family)